MAKALSDREILAQTRAARSRARRAARQEPRGRHVEYDAEKQAVVIELTNGVKLDVPVRLIDEVRDAAPHQLGQVGLMPRGDAIAWEELDVHISLSGLLQDAFGLRAVAQELGRAGGRKTSSAKAAAAKINGAKGGRPRKVGKSTSG